LRAERAIEANPSFIRQPRVIIDRLFFMQGPLKEILTFFSKDLETRKRNVPLRRFLRKVVW
jgi:hypothetical protein